MTSSNEVKIPKLIDDVALNTPLRLDKLCITYLSNNLDVLFKEPKTGDVNFLHEIRLPTVVTDALFSFLLMHSSLKPKNIIEAFSEPNKCCLQKCQLRNVSLKTSSFDTLCYMQNIQVLELFNVSFKGPSWDISKCLKLTGSKLRSLQIYHVQTDNSQCQFYYLDKNSHPFLKCLKITSGEYAWYLVINDQDPIPLISLELNNVVGFDKLDFKKPLWQKKHQFGDRLLISNSSNPAHQFNENKFTSFQYEGSHSQTDTEDPMEQTEEELMDSTSNLLLSRYCFDAIQDTLLSLTLFDTQIKEEEFLLIFKLKKLQHLDLSCSNGYETRRFISRPTTYSLWNILEYLPDLVSLDLSNTEIGDQLYIDGKLKDITGERRLGRPVVRKLLFLGLSESEGCEVVDIYSLADEVSGYNNESQIMTALQHYRHRPALLTISYNHLYTINRHQSISCPHKLLKLLVESVHCFPLHTDLSLTCTANLFFLTRQHYPCYTTQERRDVIICLMKYLKKQTSSKLVVRNVLLTLYHFEIPGDFIFRFDLVIQVILRILVVFQDQPDVNTLIINFCNTLVCSMKYDMKSEVAKHDFVPTIMSIIRRRLMNNKLDEVMLVAWSTLWNVTDETPMNSETFINKGGLTLLEECFSHFEDVEIYKNMMGLVGNIAEVKHLRPQLMNTSLVPLFHRLLIEEDQNLEVAYNISGTLSHLLSDGPAAWTCNDPHRDVVRRDMFNVVLQWDVNSQRTINYRSFLPILGLIRCDVAECIHWAVWALCNLSLIDSKYCKLLASENGVEILKTVEDKNVDEKTEVLARDVVKRVEDYLNQNQ